MEPIVYRVTKINGDYAIMISESGVENTVAMAFLPIEIAEGDALLWADFCYTILR